MNTITGQQLRQRREERRITLEQAASATRIRIHYLQAMEAGEFQAIPSLAQARGFLRAYAEYLGLNPQDMLREAEPEAAPPYDAPTQPIPTHSAQLTRRLEPARPQAEAPEPVQPDSPPDPAEATAGATAAATGKSAGAAKAARPAEPVRPAPGARPAYPSQPVPEVIPEERRRQAAIIFEAVGQTIRQQREVLGLSLEDVERHTHLRRHYLQALEDGNLEGLPSPVQGRGMLNNYAIFLGLNPEPLMLRFADGLQARLSDSRAEAPAAPNKRKPAKRKSRLRRLFAGDLLIGLALIGFLIVIVGWLTVRIFVLTSEQTPTPTSLSIAEVLLATEIPTDTPTPAPVTPTSLPVQAPLPTQPLLLATDPVTGATLPAPPPDLVSLYVTIRQRAFLRVTVDGAVEFEGRVIPGSAYTFSGGSSVELLTSNGAGIQVFYNNIDLGVLGSFGQVVNRIYGQEGMMTPTPSVTPTAGPTSTPAPASVTPQP